MSLLFQSSTWIFFSIEYAVHRRRSISAIDLGIILATGHSVRNENISLAEICVSMRCAQARISAKITMTTSGGHPRALRVKSSRWFSRAISYIYKPQSTSARSRHHHHRPHRRHRRRCCCVYLTGVDGDCVL